MELKTYLEILWRRKWVIVITTIVTTLVTAVGASMLPTTYEASTTLRVAAAGGGTASFQELMYVGQLRKTFTTIATSDRVQEELAHRLGLNRAPEVKAAMLGDTELMVLTARDPSPWLAQAAADTLAEILMDLHEELYVEAERIARELLVAQLAQAQADSEAAAEEYERVSTQFPEDLERVQQAAIELTLQRQKYSALAQQFETAQLREVLRGDEIAVFEPANLPEAPSGLPKVLYVALGFMVGLTAGVGLAFLFENLDSTLHTADQIEEVTELPVVGKIPHLRKPGANVFLDGNVPLQEAYRHLRTALYAYVQGGKLGTILLTSAEPREGKSTILANLAAAVAQSGQRVVVVDADMRKPTQHTLLGLPNGVGLSSMLREDYELKEAVQYCSAFGFWVLTSGPSPANPAELLGTPRMASLLQDLASRFGAVLIDSPPLLAVTDAAVIASMVDDVLLVVGSTQVGKEAVRSACQVLNEVQARVIGVIVNRADWSGSRRLAKYYHEPEPSQEADPLTQINGIGPVYEEALRVLGIATFAQLGVQNGEHLARSMRAYVTAKRIRRERWIEQAQELVHRDVHERSSTRGGEPHLDRWAGGARRKSTIVIRSQHLLRSILTVLVGRGTTRATRVKDKNLARLQDPETEKGL